jgi:hypothetical protein
MRDHLLIHVNGIAHRVSGALAFQSLSNFLRYDLSLIGTKVVCSEGDCGSCTVLIGRADDGKIVYRPVTSCIQFLYQLDGAPCRHDRRAQVRRPAEPRAGSDGPLPRRAVRLLHAGVRRVDVRGVRSWGDRTGAAAGGTGRQPVPVHGV